MRFFAVALFSLVFAAIVAACGPPPSSGDTTPNAIPVAPVVDVSCVFLRLTGSARVDEICATAEELAPYVPDIIAARAEADGGPLIPDGPMIAFSVPDCPVPRKPRVRRPRDAGVAIVVHPIERSADASTDAPRDAPSE